MADGLKRTGKTDDARIDALARAMADELGLTTPKAAQRKATRRSRKARSLPPLSGGRRR